MNPTRMRLRAETAAAHVSLEEAMSLSPLTAEKYGRALQVLLAVRTGWEPALLNWFPGLHSPHCSRLEADLQALGLPRLAPAAPPQLSASGIAWGYRYVLEGSALGGQVLMREAATLGHTPARGASYFAGDGPQTGRTWNLFLAALDQAATEAEIAAISTGARQAFAALEAYVRAATPG